MDIRESNLRRAAKLQGLRLAKSRARDPYTPGFGLYALIDPSTNGTINPFLADRWIHSWSLDEVEEWLTGEAKMR